MAFLKRSDVKSVLLLLASDMIILEPMGVPYCFILMADCEVFAWVSAALDTDMLLTFEKLFSRLDEPLKSMYYCGAFLVDFLSSDM